jgi:TonB family protein
MLLDFDGRYDDHQPVGGGLRRWDGLLLSVVVHTLLIAIGLFLSTIDLFNRAERIAAIEEQLQQERRERPRFVFVQPRLDTPTARPRERAEASDLDRRARTPEPTPTPSNPLPAARGNSAERVEAAPELRAKGSGPEPEPSLEPLREPVPPRAIEPPPQQQAQLSLPKPLPPSRPSGGSLGEALKNLQKYVQQESYDNPRGNAQNLGPLQFDTKGVEFGPWIRRFVSQVRRNWFIPMAAMTMRGRVVLTFFVHRSGALTDVQVVDPSPIESFNTAAVNALLASNPTEPLPPEYPDDKAFFTVTFYYNDSPR